MLAHVPYFFRLSLCLLFSAGVHGGLVYYDWMKTSVEPHLEQTPVMVSLLPAIDVTSLAVTARTQHEKNPVPPSTAPRSAPRPVQAKQSGNVSRPPASATRLAPSETLPEAVVPTAVDKPKNVSSQKIPSHEMVCKPPQDVAFDRLPVPLDFENRRADTDEPAGTGAVSAEASQKTPLALMQGDNTSVLDSEASSSPAFIEAVPEYRSNPLPEYPRLARQRHWQGVVWLMVDVSADGLVEDLRIEQSCGHQILDRAAQRAVSNWQFSPAKRDGLPVSSRARIPVRFVLEGS